MTLADVLDQGGSSVGGLCGNAGDPVGNGGAAGGSGCNGGDVA